MNRIVFTVAMGPQRYIDQALGLGRSLKLIGDPARRVVLTDSNDPALHRAFDQVVRPPDVAGPASPYLMKMKALELTDADQVLFIDADCLVFKRLDPIFEECAGSHLAIQGEWASEGDWYGQLEDLLPKLGLDAIPMFNGGMIYYERSPDTNRLLDEFANVAANYEATGFNLFRGVVPDESVIALAMARTKIGRVLPQHIDFMYTPMGLVGEWEIDVVRGACRFMKYSRDALRVLEPFILHAAKYINNTAYWRQLDKLAWLDRYELAHPPGYVSPWQRLQLSIQRSYLRHVKRVL